jgi:type I restriction enzyme M protein
MKFEAIVANPPFSAQWSANPLFMSDERFSQYGKLAPKSKADYAFLTHMVHHLDDNGTLACVLPHGALFRGAAEGHIREFIIKEKNYLDAVIGLPANIFYGTSIPTCIMVLKKYRQTSDVLFIDGSQHFEKVKTQNYLREEDIDKIISIYIERKTEDKYSYLASKEELLENEFNLNIPRYVDTFEEEEEIDLKKVSQEIQSIEQELSDNNLRIQSSCKELNISNPF